MALPAHPINGTEQYLQAILGEVQGIRSDIAAIAAKGLEQKASVSDVADRIGQGIIDRLRQVSVKPEPLVDVDLKEPAAPIKKGGKR